jgi:hypothetical protein
MVVGAVTLSPDGPPPPPDAYYVRCGDTVQIGPGSPTDVDHCRNDGCPFGNGEAVNHVVPVEWSHGGAGGAFGHLVGTQFEAGDPITHYKAPMTPRVVALSVKTDDIPSDVQPGTDPPVEVATFDDPAGWQELPTKITVWDFTISDATQGWRPSLDAERTFTAKIEPELDHNGQSMERLINFQLSSSSEPGYCLNRTRVSQPDPQWNDTGPDDADLKFPPDQAGLTLCGYTWADTTQPVPQATIAVRCLDYGAYGSLRAWAAVPPEAPSETARLLLQENPRIYYTYQVNGLTYFRYDAPIPWDEDGNCIWDGWTWNAGNALDDFERGEGERAGDGFSRYEEYRGFTVNMDWTQLNPENDRDVFVIDGNVPSLGIGSFAQLGLKPHVFNTLAATGEFLQDCTINFNDGTAHKQYQRGIWLFKKPFPPPPDYPADLCGYTHARLNEPWARCQIDDDRILAKYLQARHLQARAAIISHELGHACNLEHCETQTQECFMRAGPWDPGDGLPTLYCYRERDMYRLY